MRTPVANSSAILMILVAVIGAALVGQASAVSDRP
jgi:hypothetical protein